MTSLAQLKVDSLGRIGINTSESLQSSFNLGCSGENGTDAMISGAGKAVLKINGGTLSNVDLILKPGATLRIINNGILETRDGFEAPIGAIVDIQYGQIL